MIAALYVAPRGVYSGLATVDVWDESRDARQYDGPHSVVAHPPCSRWCRLAGLVEARYGYRRGEDNGCFAAALAVVRRWGGVLEHPAQSSAWLAHDILHPPSAGGWMPADWVGGWTCYVEQGRYGHPARKGTWLYAHGVEDLPALRWGRLPAGLGTAYAKWRDSYSTVPAAPSESRPRVTKAVAAATPVAFRDVLLDIARSATPRARPAS